VAGAAGWLYPCRWTGGGGAGGGGSGADCP